jgi:thiol:disulfide interchange protein DsbA
MKPILGLCAGLLFAFGHVAAAEEFKDLKPGKDYELIEPPQHTADPSKIEVREFFSYACPHCYQFEPYLAPWLKKKPESVEFIRQPVVFGRPQWATYARIYFTAEALGVVDKIHGDVYRTLHDERKDLQSEADIARFFADHGVPEPEFEKAYKSFSVDMKVKQADGIVNSYKKITGTPSMAVNGKYVVKGDTYDRMFEIADVLIKHEAAGGKGKH